jgi:serine/threonine protein kinase
MIHGDLKPKNIGLNVTQQNLLFEMDDFQSESEYQSADWQLKIFDFGLARRLDQQNGTTTSMNFVSGTQGYIAPEILEGATTKKAFDVTAKIDIWSLGIILH